MHQAVQKGVYYSWNNQFDEGKELFDKLRDNDPRAELEYAIMVILRDNATGTDSSKRTIIEHLESAEKKANQKMGKDNLSAELKEIEEVLKESEDKEEQESLTKRKNEILAEMEQSKKEKKNKSEKKKMNQCQILNWK